MSWVEDELAGLDLGDVRRFKRLDRVMTAMSHDSEGSLPKISNGWAETKATYRLLSNKALDWRKVLDAHAHSARQRCVGQPVVLCVQDTTELDFSSKPGIAGLGRLSYEAQHGMYVHPTLLVTPQRVLRARGNGRECYFAAVGVMDGAAGSLPCESTMRRAR